MGDLFKARFSTGETYVIEVQRHAGCDYRARLLDAPLVRVFNAEGNDVPYPLLESIAKDAREDDWTHFHGAESRDMALGIALHMLLERRSCAKIGYLTEVLLISERTRVDLTSLLNDSLEVVAGLDERAIKAEASALQSAQYADEYKRKLVKAQQELKVAARLAVDLNDQKEVVEGYVLQHVKGEA